MFRTVLLLMQLSFQYIHLILGPEFFVTIQNIHPCSWILFDSLFLTKMFLSISSQGDHFNFNPNNVISPCAPGYIRLSLTSQLWNSERFHLKCFTIPNAQFLMPQCDCHTDCETPQPFRLQRPDILDLQKECVWILGLFSGLLQRYLF